MIFIVAIGILLLLAYILLITYYLWGWSSLPVFRCGQNNNAPQIPITVIIPARNEEINIAACLHSILNGTYPKALYEIIVVDDHSTDKTASIVRSFMTDNVKLVLLQDHIGKNINSYKKKAIEVAIRQASGELIVTTDADCIVPQYWLQTFAAFYEEKKAVLIAAPVSIQHRARWIEIFQTLDFMVLQGITAASVHTKIHSMCNGANLAYTKSVFYEVNGFSGIDHIASGDDMLLMHKIFTHAPDKVFFLKSKKAIVQTAPVKTIASFFSQRIRWASKAGEYKDKKIFAVLVLVYLFNCLLLLMPVTIFFYNPKITIINCKFSLVQLWLLMLTVKAAVELVFVFPVAGFFNKSYILWTFPLMQPFHIIYMVIAGWLGKYSSYQWKKRKVN